MIDSLPLKTRVAMLEGIRHEEIIVGGYTNSDGGVCPMLAAHRRGGRTNAESFATTWDSFGAVKGRRARRATQRELMILTTHLEMSLLEHSDPAPNLNAALAEHRQLVARTQRAANRDRAASRERAADRERARAKRAIEAIEAIEAIRPGDPDRTRELRGAPGAGWMRAFRRYDEYERALARLEAQSAPPRQSERRLAAQRQSEPPLADAAPRERPRSAAPRERPRSAAPRERPRPRSGVG